MSAPYFRLSWPFGQRLSTMVLVMLALMHPHAGILQKLPPTSSKPKKWELSDQSTSCWAVSSLHAPILPCTTHFFKDTDSFITLQSPNRSHLFFCCIRHSSLDCRLFSLSQG